MDRKTGRLKDRSLDYLKSEMEIQPDKVTEKLTSFIKEYQSKLKRNGVIFGLSGGLDAAVIAVLCARAAGTDKTLALIMPEKDSGKQHIRDAYEFAKKANIQIKSVDMTRYLRKIGLYRIFPVDIIPKRYRGKLVKKSYQYLNEKTEAGYFSRTLANRESGLIGSIINRSFVYYRTKHRMRMLLLYMYGERGNRLIVGAANKSEYQIGFFVKHGIDSATDIMPIIGLYKTQIIKLAKYLLIPGHIIEKQPSPDILSGVDDETTIGLPYEKLDLILLAIEKGWTDQEIEHALAVIGITMKDIVYIRNLIKNSEHMRKVYVP